MPKIKYYYNTETCKYERIYTRPIDYVLNILGFLALAFIMGIVIAIFYSRYYKTTREALLEQENEELKVQFELIQKELNQISRVLQSLEERDDKIYRVIFAADRIPNSVREAGVGGIDRYEGIFSRTSSIASLVRDLRLKTDNLKRKLYIQSKSYDELVSLAKEKDKMLSHIPAIQPISNKELRRLSSGFGYRYHPIYKVLQFHGGIDFAAPVGTPVYATADGVVSVVRSSYGGYGKEIRIDHGYGYVTLYAHLSRFNVRPGQRVKRGQCIGYVGNTGMSTAPHLHYEVHYKGERVNPVYYFFSELSSEEYSKILELANIENQSLE